MGKKKTKDKSDKTNVMRILDKAKIPYEAFYYEHRDDIPFDGAAVARSMGEAPGAVFKTLVTRGKSGGYFVFVIPVEEELDLKAAARAVGEKSVEMLAVKDLLAVTGYLRGGCSPIGMKKPFVTVVDESARKQEGIHISAGRRGTQVLLAPDDLAALIRATFAEVTMA